MVGRDKRELAFLLQGPDQEVLPAYVDHKVSVTGLIKKTHNYGGTVDVRKYAAKKPEAEGVEPAPAPQKLSYLSPGELEQVSNPGMGAGMRGFATLRGALEMTGDSYVLVVSNGGTRQQGTRRCRDCQRQRLGPQGLAGRRAAGLYDCRQRPDRRCGGL